MALILLWPHPVIIRHQTWSRTILSSRFSALLFYTWSNCSLRITYACANTSSLQESKVEFLYSDTCSKFLPCNKVPGPRSSPRNMVKCNHL